MHEPDPLWAPIRNIDPNDQIDINPLGLVIIILVTLIAIVALVWIVSTEPYSNQVAGHERSQARH